MANTSDSIVLGGGCFWCLEGAFKTLPGVLEVVSGYSGGSVENPSYEEVCTGETGHAEVVQVVFDPGVVELHRLLELFFIVHDPTTRDRQGADIGPQYRSIILYDNESQRRIAEAVIAETEARLGARTTTELAPLARFWKAEDYHQDFFAKNPNYGYCRAVVAPKVRKALDFAESRPGASSAK